MTQTLRIDPEFKSQIPPLTQDERKQLEENILAEGELLAPIFVWNGTIVDGHNRYEILQSHPEIPAASETWSWKRGRKSSPGFANINLAVGT